MNAGQDQTGKKWENQELNNFHSVSFTVSAETIALGYQYRNRTA